jgi:hypothetical protein
MNRRKFVLLLPIFYVVLSVCCLFTGNIVEGGNGWFMAVFGLPACLIAALLGAGDSDYSLFIYLGAGAFQYVLLGYLIDRARARRTARKPDSDA